MSSLFYIWDANEHHPDVKITTLEQAEYYATHPKYTGYSKNLQQCLRSIIHTVTDPELVENFDQDIIDFFDNAEGYIVPTQQNVLDIDRYFFEKSPYLYKIVVEAIIKYDVVGFDAGAYIFFSKDNIFPKQTDIRHWLRTIQPITKDQLNQFRILPANQDKLVQFFHQWLNRNEKKLGFSEREKKHQYNDKFGFYRDFSKNIYEKILIITASNLSKYELGYSEISLSSYIQISESKSFSIFRQHPVKNFTLQYIPALHGIEGKPLAITNTQQLESIFKQIYEFLIYDAEQHKDLETLNFWINHGDEKNYIEGNAVVSRLAFAKYLNDPLYDQLIQEALPYIERGAKALPHLANWTIEKLCEEVEKRYNNVMS
ncbi:hypothetical protein [Acinetobacter seifertii]|uniref:hypothetical protein n=1 Tax=Acinetobacter seifertii TaxID=1530123 RepID=UPI00168BA2B9|nr:hypothetical protein [Acinetobacter seifertii]QNX86329.1 hypothetical protein IC772_11790 [Acinetobacter seifertii]